MGLRGDYLRWLILISLALGAGGCGLSHNPSYFPYLGLPGNIIPTHAKPPGAGYFADFDPHAHSLVVRPEEGTSPVRSQVVLIATVYDEKGQPRRNRRVEWMLEGAGNILEVDESGYFPGRGYKVDNKFAVSYTDYFEHQITRGNENPKDDFMIRPGQSWCVISSAVEGDTHVTVHAPGIHNWEKNKVHVTQHWVDAEWQTPPPSSQPAGTAHLLTTSIHRHTDHQPLAGYRVRYRVVDGPPAVFLPSRAQEAEGVSDLRGNASLQLVQLAPGPGHNRVAIEIIRPPDPTAASAPGIVIGRAETRVEWQAPGLALAVAGPAALALNQDGAYTFAVTNTGQLPLRTLTVRYSLPPGCQHVRSEPPGVVAGNQLAWTLGEVPGGQVRNLLVTLRQAQPGRIEHRVTAASDEGLRDEKVFTTEGTEAGLKLSLTGPPNGSAGVPLSYRVTLTNPGSGPATNVLLKAALDAGLESETGAQSIEMKLDGPLGPGQSRDIPLSLTPRQGGALALRVTVTADGGLSAQGQHVVQVRQARVAVRIAGPPARVAGRQLTWDVEVVNAGEAALGNVVVRQQLPAEVEFVSASDEGQLAGREVVWALRGLRAGERRSVRATVNCVTLAPAAVTRARVTAEPEDGSAHVPGLGIPSAGAIRAEAEAALEIRGLPGFRVEVVDEKDPLEVGQKTKYRIDVTNEGTLRGSQVRVTATVPKQMRVLSASGPSPHKIEGQIVTFEAKDGLEPKQSGTYVVEVEAREAGDARFQAELRAATLSEPVVVQEPTRIYAPLSPPRP